MSQHQSFDVRVAVLLLTACLLVVPLHVRGLPTPVTTTRETRFLEAEQDLTEESPAKDRAKRTYNFTIVPVNMSEECLEQIHNYWTSNKMKDTDPLPCDCFGVCTVPDDPEEQRLALLEIALDFSGATAQRFANSPSDLLRSAARLALQNLEQFGTTLPTIEQLAQTRNVEEPPGPTEEEPQSDEQPPSDQEPPSEMDDTVSVTPTQTTSMPPTDADSTSESNPPVGSPPTSKPHPQPTIRFHMPRAHSKVWRRPLSNRPWPQHNFHQPKSHP